jgi:uncharacterized protein YacL
MKLTRKIIGLIICLIIAVISYMLDNIGISLFMLSESYSFMYFFLVVNLPTIKLAYGTYNYYSC